MRHVGFSTGALAKGDFRRALSLLAEVETDVLELSALRESELDPLMRALGDLDLDRFHYVSVHVPSRFNSLSERKIAGTLGACIERAIPVVIHPDVIESAKCWERFGKLLCIENMDQRKKTGRTVRELEPFFAQLPEATFCLDIAHARQIDTTMAEARRMLRRFGERLRQVHISEIDARGSHERVSLVTVLAGQTVAAMIDEQVPIIIESVIPAAGIPAEIEAVRRALTAQEPGAWECRDWGALA